MLNFFLKAKYSFISALVFFVVANPETYKLTQTLLNPLSVFVTDKNGCVTKTGILIHTFVFFLAMWGLMLIPN